MGKSSRGAQILQKQAELPRTVGFWGAALLPVNGMIGAAIFALPALLVAGVGSFAPWMMLVGAPLLAVGCGLFFLARRGVARAGQVA